MNSLNLILASSSPYRHRLLQQLGIEFTAIAPDIDESPQPGENPLQLVERLAIEKAQAVCGSVKRSLVIGSDQVAIHNGNIVGKPRNHEDAVQQLRAASNTIVTLYTGLALIHSDTHRIQSDVVPFRVRVKKLEDALIERYLNKEKPYNCCGSLRADGLGIALLSQLEGDDPNALIGLPLIRLVDFLANEGLRVI